MYQKNNYLFDTIRKMVKRLNLLDHDLLIPGGDFLTHLDDTYVGAGEHDENVATGAAERIAEAATAQVVILQFARALDFAAKLSSDWGLPLKDVTNKRDSHATQTTTTLTTSASYKRKSISGDWMSVHSHKRTFKHFDLFGGAVPLVTQIGTVMNSRCRGTNLVWLTPLRHGRCSAAPLSKSLL